MSVFRLFVLSTLSVLAFSVHASPAHAEAQPGDACTINGAVQETGGPEQMPRRTLICNGTTWQNALEQTTAGASLFQVGNDTGSCTAAKLGRIRYNGSATWEFCNGSSWINMVGGTALSGITSATATNTINNTTYTQSWGWNGITTQNGLEMGSNSLTSGSLLGVAVTNSASTGNAIGVATNATGNGATAIRAISTGTSGVTAAIYGENASTGGAGISGQATATSGTNYGGYFLNTSSGGYGVYAANTAASGTAFGIRGATSSTTGIGVSGAAVATTGLNYGVHGTTASTGGRGVFGSATATTGATYAVYGVNLSTEGHAVVGHSTATTGTTFGVYGVNESTDGRAINGTATATSGVNYGVHGRSDSASGFGGYFANTANGWGLYSTNNVGLGAGMYLNWGTTQGTGGYGLRDNAGTLQYKNSGGAWTNIASGGGGAALSGLTAATAANSINNAAYAQAWAWNSLGNNNGLTLSTTATTGTGRLLYINASGSTGQNTALYARNAGTNGVAIFCDSYDDYGCRATVQWTSTSDARLKKNIEPLKNEYGLDAIMQLKPVTYNWKEKPDDSRKSLGFIAQDVEKIIPEIVGEDSAPKEITLPDGSTETIENPKAVQYSAIVVPLVKAVQELKAENDALHALNADLLRRVEALEAAAEK
ncbi:tail fiber domain-containing protein [Micavibrio aeruginosavorus]|uniref:Peptidase S74 domain-containing protein n=1 Tax=Micavibrio aeruginosavorus (strain ARL-13) TaxID=856793 RepID=G2KMH7_MICAA|nr:tail fiber domain-containing protein [Micavibrio aeruginosavorus]AEP10670.1 hypothetical protein MICA_2368 [Micavibrio aeruginosavorus ARL-13]